MRLVALGLVTLLLAAPALAHEDERAHRHETVDAPPAGDPDVTSENLPDEEPPPAADEDSPEEKTADTYPPPVDNPGTYRRRTIDDNDWRRRVRAHDDSAGSGFTDFDHFYFEIRFGPYTPEVDDTFEGMSCPGLDGQPRNSCTPYADFFDGDPQFYFGLEFDWLPIYVPYVVSIGPGFGWGFTTTSANTRTRSGAEAESETSMTIFPMHVSAVARFDGPLRENTFPLVPYIKAGIGFGIWSISGPNEADAVNKTTSGSSAGMHLAIGGAIALNAFDQSAAMAMKENTGISYANIWGEWMWMNLDGLGSTESLHVGSSTVVFGLALDF